MTGRTAADVQRWLDDYVAAWRSNDRSRVEALFTPDARYSYAPWGPALRGASEIADDWLRDPDEPGSWQAEYAPVAVDGDVAVAAGETRYADGRTYANAFVLRFHGDRCYDFTEYYMEHPADHAGE